MVNYHAAGTGSGICPATTTNMAAGLHIARPPTTSFAGMNLAHRWAGPRMDSEGWFHEYKRYVQ
jgi:hypothetical protein